jgi:hypothetical protein
MRRIPADFNDLDLYEHNEIPLAPEGWPTYAPCELQEGERVIVEDGSLQAEAVLKTTEIDGERWWIAVIDRATMHDFANAS